MVSAVRLPDTARATAWQAMQVLSQAYGHFSVATIASLTPAAYPPIAEWIGWLQRERVIEAERPGQLKVLVGGEAPPLSRMTNGRCAHQQRQMWAAMRQLRSWKPGDLADAASTEECEVTVSAVRSYCRALQGCGVVTERGGLWRLRPAADTGPRAPVVETFGVFDLNLGRSINLNRLETTGRAA